MPDPSAATDHSLLTLIIGKLLDWPALLFILILVLLWKSGGTILELFKSRKVEVELGGNKLSIGDAVEALDDETKQALDDFRKHQQEISALKSKIDAIENALSLDIPLKTFTKEHPLFGGADQKTINSELAAPFTESTKKTPSANEDDKQLEKSHREKVFERMIAALSNSQFRWRSVERLAIEAGVTEKEAHEILAEHHGEVVLGKGKTGRTIARLPSS